MGNVVMLFCQRFLSIRRILLGVWLFLLLFDIYVELLSSRRTLHSPTCFHGIQVNSRYSPWSPGRVQVNSRSAAWTVRSPGGVQVHSRWCNKRCLNPIFVTYKPVLCQHVFLAHCMWHVWVFVSQNQQPLQWFVESPLFWYFQGCIIAVCLAHCMWCLWVFVSVCKWKLTAVTVISTVLAESLYVCWYMVRKWKPCILYSDFVKSL